MRGCSVQRYVTVPDVLSEIRDKKARDLLESFPFKLDLQEPSEDSMKTIAWWTQKTGDASFLSLTDIKVLALTYMKEAQKKGAEELREEVEERLSNLLKEETVNAPSTEKKSGQPAKGASVKVPAQSGASNSGMSYASALFSARKTPNEEHQTENADEDNAESEGHSESSQESEHDDNGGDEEDAKQEQGRNDDTGTTQVGTAPHTGHSEHQVIDSSANEGDSKATTEDGWITPQNVSKVLATPSAGFNPNDRAVQERNVPAVCCVTGDFTMQNVLLGMGIGIASPNGRVVKKVKQFVLKCDACFQVTRDTSKKFCPSCGNAALARLGVTIDNKGHHHYHYKKNRKVNTRGTKYALPKPKGGREGDLLLREDQTLNGVWNQRLKTKEKPSNMFGEDFFVPKSDKKSQLPVGFGNKNPNERKGRERRGQKKNKRR